MKKVLFVAALAAFAVGATSCSKDYVCKCDGLDDQEYTDLGKVEAETLETSCQLSGCTWEQQ
ncbi:MAG: hypothetical protein Salg2KO_07210 [Salibacteraceae bacterium]